MGGIVGILFFAVCVAIPGYALWLFMNGRRSRSWPFVQGRITTSRIDMMSGSTFGRSSLSPVFVLEYKYEVDGSEHSGKRVAMAPKGWFSTGPPK
jgi:hypothetical protein